MIGVFLVASHARAIPAATRSARIWRFSGEPSFHLPGADVAAGPVEVDVGDPGGLLTLVAGDAGEVGVGHAGAVIALRVRGVVGQGHDRRVAVPEADHLEHRVDRADRHVPDLRVGAGGVADVLDLAVGAEDPAVRRHLLDLGLAQVPGA